MIALLAAIKKEVRTTISHLKNCEKERWHGASFYVGRLEGKDVVVANTGIGKTLSAMVTQHIIDRFKPAVCVFTGIAGGLQHEMHIGDVFLATETMQYDLDLSAIGCKRGRIPFTKYGVLRCNGTILEIARRSFPETQTIHSGRILTGDRLISGTDPKEHQLLAKTLQGGAVDMESGSMGLVASVNKVPFIIVRVISDKPYSEQRGNIFSFLGKASDIIWNFFFEFVKKLEDDA